MTSHGLNDVKADVGEDPLHVVVDRLPVLLDVPVPRFVHQAAWIFIKVKFWLFLKLIGVTVQSNDSRERNKCPTSISSIDVVFDPRVRDGPFICVRIKTLHNSLQTNVFAWLGIFSYLRIPLPSKHIEFATIWH